MNYTKITDSKFEFKEYFLDKRIKYSSISYYEVMTTYKYIMHDGLTSKKYGFIQMSSI